MIYCHRIFFMSHTYTVYSIRCIYLDISNRNLPPTDLQQFTFPSLWVSPTSRNGPFLAEAFATKSVRSTQEKTRAGVKNCFKPLRTAGFGNIFLFTRMRFFRVPGIFDHRPYMAGGESKPTSGTVFEIALPSYCSLF